MAHDVGRPERDAAVRAVLVQRAKATRTTRRRSASGGSDIGKRVPMLVTAIVLVAVVAVSVGVIAATGQRFTAAGERLATSGPSAATTAPRPSPSSSRTRTGSLVAMDGARVLTRAQLHVWSLANGGTSADALTGEEQDWLTIRCMAEHGYLYDPTLEGAQGLERGKTWGLTAEQLQGYRLALWGTDLTDPKRPYDWHDAGCRGRAVHLTGQDDEH